MTVYKSVIKTTSPKNVAVFGSSAGGALTLEMVGNAANIYVPTLVIGGISTPGLSRRIATASSRHWCTRRSSGTW